MFRCAATRVALIFISSLFALPAAAVDLGCAQRAWWGSRGIPAAFASEGSVIYAADGRGITTYDATNPKVIRELSVTPTGRPSIDVTVAGGRVIALTDSAIELFGPTSQGTLQRLDSERIEATSLVSSGNFVVSGGDDVTVWRVDGSALTLVSQARSKRKVEALTASGSLVVAAESGAGVRIYDVAGGTLRELGFASTPALDVAVYGNVLYSAAGGAGVDVIDIANPSAPHFVRRLAFGADRNMARVAVSGAYLIAADLPGALYVVDISNPLEPRVLEATDVAVSVLAASGTSILVSGSAHDRHGLPYGSGAPLQLYGIAPDNSLQLTGEFLGGSGELGGVDLHGGFAYVADPPVLHVLDIRSGAPREVARVEYGDSQDRVHVENGWALLYGRGEVHLIDITDPFNPVERGVYHSQGLPPSFVTFAGNYLIEANRASGFHVLDITNPAVQVQTTGLKNDGLGTWQGGVGMGDYVYGFAYFGIKVVDLRDKHHAKVVGFIPTGTIPKGDVAFRDTASPLLAVMDGTQLRLFDLSRPLEPLETGRVETIRAVSLTIEGSFAYLASADGTIAKIDLSDRRNPRVVQTVEGLSSPIQIGVEDGMVAVADRYAVRFLRLDETALAPPEVTLTWAPARRIALATWSGAGKGTEYEVQWATGSAFSDGGVYRTAEASAPVRVNDETFVRVRALSGCSAGAWSATKSIRRDAQGAVSFEESGRHLVVREGSAVTLSVSLRNDGATTQRVNLTASEGMTVTPAELDVPANGRAAASITIGPSATRDTFSLGAAVSGSSVGDFALRVSRVSPATRTRITAPALVLPGAGATRGANGTDWKSDLELLCREDRCDMTLAYSDARQPESETAVSLSLEAGEMTTVRDVVRSLFGAEDSGGTVVIYSDDPSALLAALYTYNDAPAGRYGQRIPAARVSTGPATATELLGIEESATARTNLGFVNPAATSAAVHVTALDAAGRSVAERDLVLAPFAIVPLYMRDFLGGGASLTGGTVKVSAPASVIAYASRVDQRTGDGTFTYSLRFPAPDAVELPSRAYTLATAGSTPGADASLWKTALQLRNGGPNTQDLRLTFFPAASVSRSSTVELALAPGETWSTEDLMATLFSALPPSDATLGAVRVEASSPLLGWARLYNTSATGTYGQYVPLRETSPSRGGTVPAAGRLSSSATRRAQMFPLAQNDAIRTNLGLVETAGRFVAIRLNVYDSAGTLLAFDDRVMEPYAAAPLLGFLGEMGLGGEAPLRVEIERTAGDGTVEAFASRVERKTNDAVTITAE